MIASLALGALLGQAVWAHDLPDALARAASQGMVLAHFWRPDCPWCEEYEKTTYREEAFSELARRFVPVRIAGEAEGAPLAERYGVRGYPTLLFLDSRGDNFGRIQGYVSLDALEAEARAAAERRAAFRHDDVSGWIARAEVFAARRDSGALTHALEQCRRLARDWPPAAALAAGVYFEEEMSTSEAADWFLRAYRSADTPRLRSYASFGWGRTKLSAGKFADAAKGLRVALDAGGLFASHRALARQLLAMSREKAGLPPPEGALESGDPRPRTKNKDPRTKD